MRRQADAQEKAKPRRRERLRGELERVECQGERLEREVTRLHKCNRRLEDENARLNRELNATRWAGCRQAAPFAKPLSGAPKRPDRRAGAAYGVASRRRAPVRVDERHHVPLPPDCPDCGGVLQLTGVATQVQEELPVPRVVVRQFEVAIGACRACGRRCKAGIGCRVPMCQRSFKTPHLWSLKTPPPLVDHNDETSAGGRCGQAVCGLSKSLSARLRVHNDGCAGHA